MRKQAEQPLRRVSRNVRDVLWISWTASLALRTAGWAYFHVFRSASIGFDKFDSMAMIKCTIQLYYT